MSNTLEPVSFDKLKNNKDNFDLILDNGKTITIDKTVIDDNSLLLHYNDDKSNNMLLTVRNNDSKAYVDTIYNGNNEKLIKTNTEEKDNINYIDFSKIDKYKTLSYFIPAIPFDILGNSVAVKLDNGMKLIIHPSTVEDNVFFAIYSYPDSDSKNIVFKLNQDDDGNTHILSAYVSPQNKYIK